MKIIPAIVATVLISASGFVHGMWTGRWRSSDVSMKATSSLNAIPERFGDWLMVGESALSDEEKKVAESAESISRRYRNQRSGDIASVLLMVGKPGPLSVHPPTACYAALGYQQIGTAGIYVCEIPGSDGISRRHLFQKAQFVSPKNTELVQPQVYWGWSADGSWSCPDNPRLAFVGASKLFKLYVAYESNGSSKSKRQNPAECILNELLPVLSKFVFAQK